MGTAERETAEFVRYSADANRRLLACCEPLTEEEWTRALGGSFKTLLATLWHIYDAEYFWVENLISGTIPRCARLRSRVW